MLSRQGACLLPGPYRPICRVKLQCYVFADRVSKIHIISVTPETDITNSAPIVMSGDMVIVPSGHRNAQVVPTDIFGLTEWDDVFNRERWVIMFGYVKYLDVFGEKQKSRFCHLYQG